MVGEQCDYQAGCLLPLAPHCHSLQPLLCLARDSSWVAPHLLRWAD